MTPDHTSPDATGDIAESADESTAWTRTLHRTLHRTRKSQDTLAHRLDTLHVFDTMRAFQRLKRDRQVDQ